MLSRNIFSAKKLLDDKKSGLTNTNFDMKRKTNPKIVLPRRIPVPFFVENEGNFSAKRSRFDLHFCANFQVAFHFGDDIWNTYLNANCGLDGPDRSKSSGSIGTTLCPATTGLAVQERPHA